MLQFWLWTMLCKVQSFLKRGTATFFQMAGVFTDRASHLETKSYLIYLFVLLALLHGIRWWGCKANVKDTDARKPCLFHW